MFIAALFTLVKIWNQPRCPSMDEWIKNLLNMIYKLKLVSEEWGEPGMAVHTCNPSTWEDN
jgi:hypothetical protein